MSLSQDKTHGKQGSAIAELPVTQEQGIQGLVMDSCGVVLAEERRPTAPGRSAAVSLINSDLRGQPCTEAQCLSLPCMPNREQAGTGNRD